MSYSKKTLTVGELKDELDDVSDDKLIIFSGTTLNTIEKISTKQNKERSVIMLTGSDLYGLEDLD